MNILLPIETINREIDFKVVLAGFLAGEGHKVWLGQHDFLMQLLPSMRNGIYVGKNIFHKATEDEKGERYYALKEREIDVIYLHEEGAVFSGDSSNWKAVLNSQYDPRIFTSEDRLCVWGDFQNEHDQDRLNGSDVTIFTTGHPRFDLYKPEWRFYFENEVTKIKERYPSYILLSGNYGIGNHGYGVDFVFSRKGAYYVDDVERRLKKVRFYNYQLKQIGSMIELAHVLAVTFPEKHLIYRPHPSENHDYYKTIFKGVSNLVVNHEGPVAPWLMGADAVIHDGCTTAIEASLANTPVINYKPIQNNEFDIWIANQFGKRATTISEVVDLLNNPDLRDRTPEEMRHVSEIRKYFYNFKGSSFDALLQIISEKLGEKNNSKNESESPSQLFIQSQYVKNAATVKAAEILSLRSSSRIKYHKTKFYGFSKDVIEKKFSLLSGYLGKSVNATYHNPYLIEIT